jgi:hypothetical protein
MLQLHHVLRAGDWVEVDEDHSVGLCSEGGAGMVVKVATNSADVKYIMGGRTEKEVSKQRIVTIPMPYRGTKATTRSTSSTHTPKAIDANIEAVKNNHPFRSTTSMACRLQQTTLRVDTRKRDGCTLNYKRQTCGMATRNRFNKW